MSSNNNVKLYSCLYTYNPMVWSLKCEKKVHVSLKQNNFVQKLKICYVVIQ